VSSPAEIRERLADVLHDIAGVSTSDVRDTASLKDLGVDSLASVELAEGLERTFRVTPPDVDIAEWRTVGDVVRTVTRQQAVQEDLSLIPTPPELVDPEQTAAFKQLALFFAIIGAALGVGLGVVMAIMLTTIGFGGGSMPEVSKPHIPSHVAPNNDFGPSVHRRTTAPAKADLKATPTQVAPGKRFTLAGRLPDAREGEALRIRMRDAGGVWEDFPVTVRARTGGTFSTELYTSRTGAHQFRVESTATRKGTPTVTVTIGS
jgi:acyl carrier protein